MTATNDQPMTHELALTLLAQLRAENAALKAAPPKKLSFKVSEKGAVSVYGLSARFPTTLYASQWERLLGASDEIKAFIAANAALVARKA